MVRHSLFARDVRANELLSRATALEHSGRHRRWCVLSSMDHQGGKPAADDSQRGGHLHWHRRSDQL